MAIPSVVCCLGTRPEAIKMAPVIRAFREQPELVDCQVLLTAQHRQLADEVLRFFDITPDVDLNVMQPGQSLTALTARLLIGIDQVLEGRRPDIVLAQGDTTTVLCAALSCFYRKIPFGHVEAGLRTGELSSPFPEEGNRVLAGHLAALHFAPTESARRNLQREGISDSTVHVTGNTVIDALFMATRRAVPLPQQLDSARRLILVTAHRRENFGQRLWAICHGILEISRRFPDVQFLWPVHPNPSVRPVVEEILSGKPGIHLCPPLTYGQCATAMQSCHFVMTDSGGIQEEAPALGKPVLVLRDQSERPEAIEAGVARLCGTQTDRIVAEASALLTDSQRYDRMSAGASPYGDGKAAQRIVRAVGSFLKLPQAADLAA